MDVEKVKQDILNKFPEIKDIHFGKCPGDPIHYMALGEQSATGRDAHTHMCPEDKFYHNVCFSHAEDMLNSDDTFSDGVWHEYGHVLDNTPLKCGPLPDKHTVCIDLIGSWEEGHHKGWVEIMNALGKPASKWVSIR